MHKMIVGSCIAATLGGFALPAAAHSQVDYFVNVAPSPARYEVVPVQRVGYAWIPGYWDWRGRQHVWVAGYYVRHRPGHYYAQPRWVSSHGGWRQEYGGWRRDRDGDGVPNRFDRRPDNPRYY